jgi:transcriptional regulator with XRE-family HTH domain
MRSQRAGAVDGKTAGVMIAGSAGLLVGPTMRRRRLGTELRRLRENGGYRLEDVAAKLDVAPSTLSRIETGKAPARTSYVHTMLDFYGVGDREEREYLVDLAREGQRKGWWAGYDDLLPQGMDSYLGLEGDARKICTFTVQTVPGLLQTRGFGRANRPAENALRPRGGSRGMTRTKDDTVISVADVQGAGGVAARAAEVIADALSMRDFDICEPGQPGSAFLQVTNVCGARCELTVYDSGRLDWEYRHQDGDRSDPCLLAAMTLRLLGGDHPRTGSAHVTHHPQQTLKGQVGRAAADQGMQVCQNVLDKDAQLFEVYAEIPVTNPARPDRGTVRIADDGLICWHCQVHHPGHPENGLEIGEITTTLAQALTAARQANLVP